jgi:hypothetical protein
MKLFSALRALLTLAGAVPVAAQPAADQPYLYPIREGRKLGFINRAGEVVVPPTYDAVGPMSGGRIRVSVGAQSGYIDLTGKLVIPAQYDTANEFQAGRAVVRQGDKYSLIDPAGKHIADIPFRVLGEFHQGLLRVQASGRTDADGKRLPTAYGFVDLEGEFVIPPTYINAGEFPDDEENLNFGALNREWCYFDRTGRVIIRIPFGPNLTGANLFVNGRLLVKDGFTYGYQDAAGKWAIPPKYNDAHAFEDGFAQVLDGTKWITIDTSGKEVDRSNIHLRRLKPYSEGLALATENGLYGYIDSRGRLAFPLRKYDEAYSFSSGLARIKVDGAYGYLDRTGKLAIPAQYSSASDFDHGLASVMTRDGYGYIDPQAKLVWQAPLPKIQLKP